MATGKQFGLYRPWISPPQDMSAPHEEQLFRRWLCNSVNSLINQASQFNFNNIAGSLDPTTSQLTSAGSRTASLATPIQWVASSTGVSFYWDGTNSSVKMRVYRDDATVAGPFSGNLAVTGLAASTLYYVYPYFDDVQQAVKFASNGSAVGTPAVCYVAQNAEAIHTTILKGNFPLAVVLATSGFSTPASGSSSGSGGSGGGGLAAGVRYLS